MDCSLRKIYIFSSNVVTQKISLLTISSAFQKIIILTMLVPHYIPRNKFLMYSPIYRRISTAIRIRARQQRTWSIRFDSEYWTFLILRPTNTVWYSHQERRSHSEQWLKLLIFMATAAKKNMEFSVICKITTRLYWECARLFKPVKPKWLQRPI